MKRHGTYKILRPRESGADRPDPLLGNALRTQRIVDSLRCEISNNEHVQELR